MPHNVEKRLNGRAGAAGFETFRPRQCLLVAIPWPVQIPPTFFSSLSFVFLLLHFFSVGVTVGIVVVATIK